MMDFKSLMSKQISKAKTVSSSSPPPNGSTTTTKYLRRAELEAQRQADYAAEQARIEAERDERARKKRKLEEDEADAKLLREEKLRKLAEDTKRRREADEKEEERRRRKRLGLPELVENTSDSKDGTPIPESEDMPDEEVRLKLRDVNEPIALFDETQTARLRRYRSLIAKSLAPKLSNTPIPTTIALLDEKDMRLPDTMPSETDISAIAHLYRQLASYLTLILTEWSVALSSRSPSTTSSSTGIQATNNYTTSLRDLTPLFRQFESRSLKHTLLTALHEITLAIQKRRYVDANDAYLRLSIGKAAWPIGVTMVGIHERSAREKLHETDQTAHIMSDEVTRKWLQSVKRCLTFAQVRWEPESAGQMMG